MTEEPLSPSITNQKSRPALGYIRPLAGGYESLPHGGAAILTDYGRYHMYSVELPTKSTRDGHCSNGAYRSVFERTNQSSNRVTFNMSWLPQGSMSGVIVAIDQGFYREVGLEVSDARLRRYSDCQRDNHRLVRFWVCRCTRRYSQPQQWWTNAPGRRHQRAMARKLCVTSNSDTDCLSPKDAAGL